jgi:hypothetical protein
LCASQSVVPRVMGLVIPRGFPDFPELPPSATDRDRSRSIAGRARPKGPARTRLSCASTPQGGLSSPHGYADLRKRSSERAYSVVSWRATEGAHIT